MSPFELTRYLDYCSEMLSLTSKLAAVYAQNLPDPGCDRRRERDRVADHESEPKDLAEDHNSGRELRRRSFHNVAGEAV
jgi:hypothetical protein